MKNLLRIILLPILLFYHFLCFGTTYYVSNAGSDSNNGTSTSTPWKTPGKVSLVNTFVAGDQILFNRGEIFYGTLIINNNGASGNPITIGAYGTGANPVITGFISITSWTNLGSNIWESSSALTTSTLPDVNCVLVNGAFTPMGRTPNNGYYTYQSFSGTTSITSSNLTGSPNWTGAGILIKNNNFDAERGTITGQSGGTLTFSSPTNTALSNNFGFFIEDDKRTLDQQNEWYYNPASKKLDIYSTATPTSVQAATLDTLFYMTNKSYVTVDGIDFTGSNKHCFFLSSIVGVTIQNCNITNHGLYAIWGGSNMGSASTRFNINHCNIRNIGCEGIVLQSEYKNPYIGYDSITGTNIYPGMIKEVNSRWDQSGEAISAYPGDSLHVEHCFIDSCGYVGIHFETSDVTINNNEVAHTGLNLQDGGGIYTWMVNETGNTNMHIINNIVRDGVGDSTGTPNADGTRLWQGIYMDDASAHIELSGNSAFNNPDAGIFLHGTSNSKIINNTSYNNGGSAVNYQYSSYINFSTDTMKKIIYFLRS